MGYYSQMFLGFRAEVKGDALPPEYDEPRPHPVIESDMLHTDDAPFCSDLSCDCHRDRDLLDEYVYAPIQAGITTLDEARRLWYGGKDVTNDTFDREVI